MNLDLTDALGYLAGGNWAIVIAALKSSYKQTIAAWIDAARAVWGKEETPAQLAKLNPDKVLRALVVVAMLLSLWWATFWGMGWFSMKLMPAGLIFGGICLITGGTLWATFGPAPSPANTNSTESALNQQLEVERESRKKSEGETSKANKSLAAREAEIESLKSQLRTAEAEREAATTHSAKDSTDVNDLRQQLSRATSLSVLSPSMVSFAVRLGDLINDYKKKAQEAMEANEKRKDQPGWIKGYQTGVRIVVTSHAPNKDFLEIMKFVGRLKGFPIVEPGPPAEPGPHLDADNPPLPPQEPPTPSDYVVVRYPSEERAAQMQEVQIAVVLRTIPSDAAVARIRNQFADQLMYMFRGLGVDARRSKKEEGTIMTQAVNTIFIDLGSVKLPR
ncbi:MAG: hypothetical protein IKE60_02500 [Reyranella sp.]|uniref:hypothetical protein n=1 Tax=Reyranella sp. TaxID=1929291 RepID=UPI0025DE49E4|nr:hypothetical protein [Reyranella sp.]MBR2813493.1 hypothetical protein [Reyranella sp.]